MTAVLVAVVFGYGWWAVSLPPFSASATVAVLAAGLVVSLVGTLAPRPQRTQRRLHEVAPWAVVGGAALLWQLAAYLQQPREEHPTLSSLTNALLDSQPRRTAAFVLWLLAAAVLARR